MAKINFKFKFGKLDALKKSMQQIVVSEMNLFWDDALKVFIDETVSNMKLDTGMSRASLLPLAARIGYEFNINNIRSSRKGYTTITGEYRSDGIRDIQHGIDLGRRAYTLKRASISSPSLDFSFKIVVYQHLKYEDMQESLERGKEAMVEWMNQNKSELENKIGRLYRKVTGTYFRG